MSFLSTVSGIDTHRKAIPIDHPDQSITRAKLEYPTVDVNFAYLAAIGKTTGGFHYPTDNFGAAVLTADSFTDKAVHAWIWDRFGGILGRYQDRNNFYICFLDSASATADFRLYKLAAGTIIVLSYEAADIGGQYAYLIALSISGSTLKIYRDNPSGLADTATTLRTSATDTSLISGSFGPYSHLSGGGHSEASLAWLRAPLSPSLQANAILEVNVAGSGAQEDPFRPNMPQNLIEVSQLTGLPGFLYSEAKKYEVLRNKGFTDEEIKLLLGYIPQHQVDLNAATWGAFEFSEKSATNIIIITKDNPYQAGAIQKQINYTKSKNLRVLTPPKDYAEAVTQYQQLSKDFPHWLAGKDNYAYHVLGFEELEALAVADFYYGELIEHKTHYAQLKRVPDWELENTLNMWLDRLNKITVLTDKRDKHIKKLEAVLKLGW